MEHSVDTLFKQYGCFVKYRATSLLKIEHKIEQQTFMKIKQ